MRSRRSRRASGPSSGWRRRSWASSRAWRPARRRIGVSFQARRFDDPAGLRAWARHALGHTEDAIDPDFGFEPGWDGLPGRGRLAARLHALRDASIDTRAEALHESAGSEGRMARRRTAHAGAIAGLWPELAGDG